VYCSQRVALHTEIYSYVCVTHLCGCMT